MNQFIVAYKALCASFKEYTTHFWFVTTAGMLSWIPSALFALYQMQCGLDSSPSNIILTVTFTLFQTLGTACFFNAIITKSKSIKDYVLIIPRVFTFQQCVIFIAIDMITFSLVFMGVSTQCPTYIFNCFVGSNFLAVTLFAFLLVELGYLKNFFILSALSKKQPLLDNLKKSAKLTGRVWIVPPIIALLNSCIFHLIPFNHDFILKSALMFPLTYPLSNIFVVSLYKTLMHNTQQGN